jgi:DNA-binding winged helix-turn-helix (wHTH) protein
MSQAGLADVAFGPFRLFVRERALLCGERPVALTGRAFDLLLTLVESETRIVSKDELMERVWAGLVVEENNLHVQMSRVRRALGGHGDYIQTVSGRGYRFVGEVRRLAGRPHRLEAAQAALALGAALASLRELSLAGPAAEVARLIAASGSASANGAAELRSAGRFLMELLDALEVGREPRSFRPTGIDLRIIAAPAALPAWRPLVRPGAW